VASQQNQLSTGAIVTVAVAISVQVRVRLSPFQAFEHYHAPHSTWIHQPWRCCREWRGKGQRCRLRKE
jgi:hypothetical protein